MRRLLLLFLSVTLWSAGFAQANKVTAYIDRYKDIAMEEMIRTGVPASITLAQGILESGCGESALAKESNNHFGIKCKTEWTGAKTYHDDDARNECFRVYASAEDSYRDHSNFLRNRPYYTNLFSLNPRDYTAWAYGLKKDGYATEKDYPKNLIHIIETYHLEDYSDIALAKEKDPNDVSANYALNNKDSKADIANTNLNATATVQSSDVAIPVHTERKMRVAQTMVTMPSYPVSVFTINDSKVIYAPKGLSLLALADKQRIGYHRLLELNDLTESDIISSGELIYLQKKSKKGNKDFYLSKYGETLKEVSDKEGVLLKRLEEYNHLSAGKKLASNQKIYLKGDAPNAPLTIED
ncbi:glycoside hydrolase family 73 protein [Arachidicoccus sp.]|uniref:glycoside hydrolase family 73 protein n=1 Tax=Arachidicoccus sp. TaxID=1872624 RepID=UPI003D240848